MARKSAKQIAASRRNILKAQAASARARRGKGRSKKTGHHYGSGKTGRKNTRRAKYGSVRHGISPTQQLRRNQRTARRKRVANAAFTAGVTAAVLYSDPSVRAASKYYGSQAKVKYGNLRTRRQFNSMMKNAGIKVK